MISEARLQANRRKALCNTGPKSPAGKAHVGQNLVYGLTSTAPLPHKEMLWGIRG